MIRTIALVAGLSLATLAGAAWADDPTPAAPPAPPADASQTPPLRALCTDRPTKTNSPCTVDPGHFQLETDFANVTVDHSGGADTTTVLYTNPTLKYGVSDTVDLEASIVPYETIVSRDRASNVTARNEGVGDFFFRVKWALIGAAGGNGLAFIPYLKAPTASGGVGNGVWEGGLIVPVQVMLPANWSVVFDPEIDVLKDPLDDNHHLAYSNLICFTYPLSKTVNGSVELWGGENDQPGHVLKQASADVAATWIPPSDQNLQFDGGVNFGLTNQTPAAQIYVGVSRRF
jgi:hypothetical protein